MANPISHRQVTKMAALEMLRLSNLTIDLESWQAGRNTNRA